MSLPALSAPNAPIDAFLQNVGGELQRVRASLEAAEAAFRDVGGTAWEDMAGDIDRRLRDAHATLDGARRGLTLCRPGQYVPLDLARLLRERAPQNAEAVLGLDRALGATVTADAEQVETALYLVRHSVELERGGHLSTELYQRGSGPRVFIRISGPGKFAREIRLPGRLNMPWTLFVDRWTAATGGGAVEAIEEQGLAFDFAKSPKRHGGDPRCEPAGNAVANALRRLMPWRAASGHYEGEYATEADMRRWYSQAAEAAVRHVREAQAALGTLSTRR